MHHVGAILPQARSTLPAHARTLELRLNLAPLKLSQSAHFKKDEHRRGEDGQEVRQRRGEIQRIQTRELRKPSRQYERQHQEQRDEEQDLARERQKDGFRRLACRLKFCLLYTSRCV